MLMLMGIGMLIEKLHLTDEGFPLSLTRVLINIFIPIMIIRSFTADYIPGMLQTGLVLIGLSTLFAMLMMGIGHGVFLAAGRTPWARLFRYCVIFTNFTYIGLPVMQEVFGETGVFYCLMSTLPVRVLLYMMTKPLLSGMDSLKAGRPSVQKMRGMLTPPVLAVIPGLLIYISGFRFPAVINSFMGYISGLCFPLGMILCGMVFAKNDFREHLRWKALVIPLVRLAVVPVIALCAVLALPVMPEAKAVLVVSAALPVPATTTTFAMEYSDDPELQYLSSGCVLWATILSTITIPVWSVVVHLLFPGI